ncbi:MAG TPA: SET domain-containing protein [Bacteroidia bacterium]|nr:SET domain-containing protein [Bacteroidia bacterium]
MKISKISGMGLFADEDIPKGTTVWKFEPNIDVLLSKQEIEKLTDASKEQVYNYAFLDVDHKKYMLCGDDARFFNHSDNSNCTDEFSNITVALRDIKAGEELTVNYKKFYGDMEKQPELL